MRIAVAGKYSAETAAERQANFEAMNQIAARLLEKGHTPLIGVNAALPVVQRADVADEYEAIMQISMAVVSACDAILLISNSKGTDREREFFLENNKPVYYSIEEIP
jgi:nucleoside 2-deoxyribosyltransferase